MEVESVDRHEEVLAEGRVSALECLVRVGLVVEELVGARDELVRRARDGDVLAGRVRRELGVEGGGRDNNTQMHTRHRPDERSSIRVPGGGGFEEELDGVAASPSR